MVLFPAAQCAQGRVIARNDAGKLVAAECGKYMNVRDTFLVEVLACRDTILLTRANDCDSTK